MKVVIIDGQGGRLGAQIAEAVKAAALPCEIYGIGTNTIATQAMLKGGVDHAATGENPIIVACRDADVIVGPIGIISADSLLGEITPAMAVAIGQSLATKLLIPINHCDNLVVGVRPMPMNEMIAETVNRIKEIVTR